MKQVLLAATTLTLCLSACTQTIIVHPSDAETMARYGYVKQATPASPTSTAKNYANNPDAAFDHQVAAYAAEQAPTLKPTSNIAPTPAATTSSVTDILSPLTTAITALVEPVATPATPAPRVTAAPVLPAQPAQNQNTGVMDYKVKVTNGTPNRLFIEAQDANGTIYPCGFMQPGQSEVTKMEQVQAMASPVLVVVRDPDQPGAPELRRYRIPTPNQSYAGKTVEFTVIPKGCYAGAIDGQPYVQSGSDE